ncbi:hypothetical protein FKM82_000186 [Ascaphus truei]
MEALSKIIPRVISSVFFSLDQTHEKRSPPPALVPVTLTNSLIVSKSRSAESPTVMSNLSVNAVEFYPSGYATDFSDSVDENGGYPILPHASLAEFVQDFMNHLTEQPGSFEAEIDLFSEVLKSWVTTDDSLQELIELIYQQATSVPNFSYTGARLCNFLSLNLHINSKIGNFRQLLLQRCRSEYEKRDQSAKGDDAMRKRFHAFVLFLGELYLNLEIKGAKGQVTRAEILQSGLKEILSALFSKPVDDNLICAVKLLKLTGSVLEDAWKDKGKSDMEEMIQRMENVVLDANCSRLKMANCSLELILSLRHWEQIEVEIRAWLTPFLLEGPVKGLGHVVAAVLLQQNICRCLAATHPAVGKFLHRPLPVKVIP